MPTEVSLQDVAWSVRLAFFDAFHLVVPLRVERMNVDVDCHQGRKIREESGGGWVRGESI